MNYEKLEKYGAVWQVLVKKRVFVSPLNICTLYFILIIFILYDANTDNLIMMSLNFYDRILILS